MADFYTDIHSIQHSVHQSRSEEEAKDRFNQMQGISLTRQQADLAFKTAYRKRFKNEKIKSEANFLTLVYAKYIIAQDDEEIKKKF